MNVLIHGLRTNYPKNGLTVYLEELVKSYSKQDSGTFIYVFINSQTNLNFCYEANVHLIPIKLSKHSRYKNWLKILVFNLNLNRYVKKHKIDVVHLVNPTFLLRKRYPLITTIHDIAENKGYRHNYFYRQYRIFINWIIIHSSDKLICVSNSTSKAVQLNYNIDPKKIITIYNGSGTISSRPKLSKSRSNLSPNFVHISGGAKNKNIDRVINAFLLLNKKFPNAKLSLIGKYSIKNEFNNVNIYDNIDDNAKYLILNDSTALIYPSLNEGFGFPILEAMSMGVPVITSNRSSMKEIAGSAALFVDPLDVKSIYEAMKFILSNKDQRINLSKLGLDRIKLFDWDLTALKTLKAYHFVKK